MEGEEEWGTGERSNDEESNDEESNDDQWWCPACSFKVSGGEQAGLLMPALFRFRVSINDKMVTA